jgi:hypothetical protein
MIRKRIAGVLAAFAMAALAVLAVASPAAASESNEAVDTPWSYEYSKECHYLDYVSGCIQPNGDVLWVKDNVPNGYSVSLTWVDTDSTRSGTCIDYLGSDAGWGTCDKDFTEGHEIKWALGWNSSTGWHFSSWYYTTV